MYAAEGYGREEATTYYFNVLYGHKNTELLYAPIPDKATGMQDINLQPDN